MPRRAIAALLVAALLVVGGMIVVVKYLNGRSSSDSEPVAADVTVTQPSESVPPSWPVTPSPAPDDVELGDGTFTSVEEADPADVESVAITFAEVVSSWDTALDTSEKDALDRAAPLMAPEMTLPPSSERATGWAEPFEHRAFSVPNAVPYALHDAPPASALVNPMTGEQMTPFAVCVPYSWEGRDAWSQLDAGARLVHLSLVQREGQWKVIEYGYLVEPCDAFSGGSNG